MRITKKQASSVIKQLQQANYFVVPLEPSNDMINDGKIIISYGATRPSDLVKNIYQAMIKSFLKL